MPSDEQHPTTDASHEELRKELAEAQVTLRQLRSAMPTNRLIGVATGILAERLRVTPERALDTLVRASQNDNRKLRDVAMDVVNEHRGLTTLDG
ncbi:MULTISPECIES: ANTAR domain-containing protein [Actinosynnema]|uniref:ANTAR domain-containing protein n=1 Tax=Actinosynnema TaxID=40566 RepID=UPI0020A26186|nr:ANTAR domain-containing protein [Actinosynnema pretiosum]MCP2096161.1 ANTAR domain-containing protein [Actinosynnema pretiosum]